MIKVLHLYYDLMNLYGESGNILAITNHLKNKKLDYKVDYKSIGDKINFDDYNLVYIGCGTENNQKIALKHLTEYKEDVKEYIDNNKVLIATGNSYELFGKFIENTNGKRFKGLSIFNYSSKEVQDRIVKQINNGIKGFINSGSIVTKNHKPLFTIKDYNDGFKYKNFYGTHIIGPLLVLNDNFLKDIIKSIDL